MTDSEDVCRVYLLGASGTGKTTLAEALEGEDFYVQASTTRQVLAQWTGEPPHDLLLSPDKSKYMALQKKIFESACVASKEVTEGLLRARRNYPPPTGRGIVVVDRSIDHMAYAAWTDPVMAAHMFADMKEGVDYQFGEMLRPTSLVMYLPPHPTYALYARASRDPRMQPYLTDKAIHTVDGAIRGLILWLRYQGQTQIFTLEPDTVQSRTERVRTLTRAYFGRPVKKI